MADFVDRIVRECRSVPAAAGLRAIRRRYSKELVDAPPSAVLRIAHDLCAQGQLRWFGYELLFHHAAFGTLRRREIEALGRGIDSWWTVDAFGRILAGPAWVRGQISDDAVLAWAKSRDLWWRRAALVSTVAWNMRSQGGPGDTSRTLKICELLLDDREDMVVKAVSWALRALIAHDADAVRRFLDEQRPRVAARVAREVTSKLRTGLKNG